MPGGLSAAPSGLKVRLGTAGTLRGGGSGWLRAARRVAMALRGTEAGAAVFQEWFVRDGIGGNPFRFLLGITGGSFPISHRLPAPLVPLGHTFGAGRVGWGCRGQLLPVWALCGTLLGTASLKNPSQVHLSPPGHVQLPVRAWVGRALLCLG